MSQTVLITGATGFTGSFLVAAYVQAGWDVHGTYRTLPADRSWLPAGVHLHQLDLCNTPATRQLVRTVRPDVVQHLAAQSSVAASVRDPMATLTGNAGAQQSILEAVRDANAGATVVVVGSCDEYGRVSSSQNPVSEDTPLLPANPYALSKVVQDLMGYQYFIESGMRVVRARPFLQLGPRRSDRFVAGAFARQVAEVAWGRHEPRISVGSVDLLRDFTDVRDVAAALMALGAHGQAGEVYNVASGVGRSLRELLRMMLELARVDAEVYPDSALQRAGEVPLLVGDATKLRQVTGWEPAVPFEQSVADTLQYWIDRVGATSPPAGGTP